MAAAPAAQIDAIAFMLAQLSRIPIEFCDPSKPLNRRKDLRIDRLAFALQLELKQRLKFLPTVRRDGLRVAVCIRKHMEISGPGRRIEEHWRIRWLFDLRFHQPA